MQPPSRVGKDNNFFNLREQLATVHKRMPSKNEKSTSFAVSEEKVARQKFTFNPLNMLLREKGVQRKQSAGAAWDHEQPAGRANRHESRNNGLSHSIDFVFHTEIKGPRLASDGGVFPVGHGGQSPAAVKRLGTAEGGHGKQFLITDFKKNIKNPHFSQNYSSNLAKQPKGFSFNRSEFSDVCNSIGAS